MNLIIAAALLASVSSCKTRSGSGTGSATKGIANILDKYSLIQPSGYNFYKVWFNLDTKGVTQNADVCGFSNDWKFYLIDTQKSDISKGIVKYYASWSRQESCPSISGDAIVQSDSPALSVAILAVESDVIFDDYLSAGSVALNPEESDRTTIDENSGIKIVAQRSKIEAERSK